MSKAYISAALRNETVKRANSCCEYCRISQVDIFFSFEIDLIIAEKHGGTTELMNLCLACPDCNGFKGSDIASVDWSKGKVIVPLFNPRQHSWDAHFSINTETGEIMPLTPEGRVTVFLLHLNDAERIKDRKLLLDAKRYPCLKV